MYTTAFILRQGHTLQERIHGAVIAGAGACACAAAAVGRLRHELHQRLQARIQRRTVRPAQLALRPPPPSPPAPCPRQACILCLWVRVGVHRYLTHTRIYAYTLCVCV
jgi:hypothetical protein